MSMSKKDYELIASLIAAERMMVRASDGWVPAVASVIETTQQDTLDSLVERMSEAFKADNPNFQPSTFDRAARSVTGVK